MSREEQKGRSFEHILFFLCFQDGHRLQDLVEGNKTDVQALKQCRAVEVISILYKSQKTKNIGPVQT